MEPIIVKYLEKPQLNEPVLIEGLPGVGNVGKISAEYLKEKLQAKLFVEIYSKYLPPQVLMKGDGTLYLVKNEMYYHKNPNGRDLIILVGDYQGMNAEGQYELSYKVLEIAKELGTKLIFTLGGYGTGNLVEEPRVFGAATDMEMVEEMKEYGVYFSPSDPSGGIVGAAGLLLGLGSVAFDMRGVCLMGETSGYFSDPKSALNVLKIVDRYFNLSLDLEEMELRSKEITEITSQIKEEQKEEERHEDLGYIG
ncbi:TIGR00162 family protein [Aciduliprofundum sp. MAR08-339]|uniref:proteasome assembly chaperone family protein n=1 Tax=Aciduliprofundum sp. (strain MAR08-339) TaxID=673860 RepID=UPI0002A4A827|nr:TIGR00162 family protein [Aciduliprofundum sp. MAR08-339]